MLRKLPVLMMILLSYSLIAQNYQPFEPGIRYQFINSTKDTITTLMIDSIAINNNDSLFYFNSTFNPLAKNENRKDSNNVFGYLMYPKEKGEYWFITVEKDSFLIKTRVPLQSKWTFAKGSDIEATYVSKKDTSIFGIRDSVMVIHLTDNNIIELSKNFGFIKTVNFNSYFNSANINPLVLDAIPEHNMGKYLSDPFVYYDFEVGDVFVYSSGVSSPSISRRVKKEILERRDYNDSIVYTIKRSKIEILDENGVNERATYTQDTIKEIIQAALPIYMYDKIDPYSLPRDLYGWEEGLNSYAGMNLLSNDYVFKNGLASRAVITRDESNKFKMEISNSPIFSLNFSVTYKEGLGWTNLNYSVESQQSIKNASLVCYIKKNESFGDCSEVDRILSTEVKESEESISVFPNPAYDMITLSIPNNSFGENTILIYNSLGSKVYTKKLESYITSYSINVEDLVPGIYYAEIEGKKAFRKSFVKF